MGLGEAGFLAGTSSDPTQPRGASLRAQMVLQPTEPEDFLCLFASNPDLSPRTCQPQGRSIEAEVGSMAPVPRWAAWRWAQVGATWSPVFVQRRVSRERRICRY